MILFMTWYDSIITSIVNALETIYAKKTDLNNYIQKSNTSGLINNDGTIDTNLYATVDYVDETIGELDDWLTR